MPAMRHMAGNFFLVGLMGAGKSTLGKKLAAQLSSPFYDSDNEICQRTGVDIPTIFAMEGEQGFRDRECIVISELASRQGIILATGGGAVLREENRCCLKSNGVVLYLHAQPDVLFERVRHDKNRPLLQVENPLDKLLELYKERDTLYRQTAHFVVEVGGLSCHDAFNQVLSCIRR